MPSRSNRRFIKPTPLAILLTLTAAMFAAARCGGNAGQTPAAGSAPAPSSTTASPVHVIVSDETGGRIAIIDATTGAVIDTVAVGKRPRGLRVLRDGTHVLVALSGSPIAGPGVDESKLPPADRAADGIGVVDLATRQVVRMIQSGQDPETFALSPDEQTLYVSNEESAEMSVVDVAKGAVRAHVPACEEPEGVTVRPGSSEVYMTCEGANAVAVIDAQKLAQVTQIPTGARPRSIAFTPDGAIAFVTNENAAAITVIDANARRPLDAIALHGKPADEFPPRPMGTALSPDGRLLYVSTGRAKGIVVIDVGKKAVQGMYEDVGQRPWGIAISPDGKTLFTANGPSGDVSFIDASTGAVQRKVKVGGSPWGVAVIAK
jgi:YVTN family beta-propeller protein